MHVVSRHRRGLIGFLLSAFCSSATALRTRAALAADPEDFSLRLLVPVPPGAGTDAAARLIVRHMELAGGIKATVNNHPGGNGVIAANALRNASLPDGVAMFSTTGLLSVVPMLAPEIVSFSPEKEILPIATVGLQKYLLSAGPSINLKALLNRQSTPGATAPFARIGVVGSASITALYARVLSAELRKPLDLIPYRGLSDVTQALLSGQVELALLDEISARVVQTSGKVRFIAAMSPEPCILFPSVALWHELGFPVFNMDVIFAVYAGSRMSQTRRNQLAARLAALGRKAAFQEELRNLGMKPLVLTGADAQRYVQEAVLRERGYLKGLG